MSQVLQPLVSYASGSVGDTVFARNQHGPYTRRRTTPTDPNTPRMQAVRRTWARAHFRWTDILSAEQRESWIDYAAHREVRTPALRATRLSGQQAYMRANVVRGGTGFGWVDTAPTIYRDPQWTPPTQITCPGAGFVLFTIDPSDEWANIDNSGLVVSVGDERTAATNFFKAPFRRATIVRGFAATPPAATQFTLDPWGPVSAPRRWLRSYPFLADGRVAGSVIQAFDDNA